MAAGLIWDIVLIFWRVVINLFFREIRPRGAFNIPREGPILFICGPHANQFLDPLLLFSEVRKEAQRRVAVLIAAKSMQRRFVGIAAGMMDSIPVARAADDAKAGAGKIRLSEDNPLIVIGLSTEFTAQVKARSQLVLPKTAGYATATVHEVVSDTELKLKGEFVVAGKDANTNVKASAKLREGASEGWQYKVLPYVDQEETYGAVFQRLNEGGCIGIFPEGGSHDRTDFLPLKAGFSIMALGAMAANPNLDVKLVPVGLSYFHPHKFRSRAVVEFGPPISVDPELVEMYKAGGGKKRDACGKLLEQVHDGLRAVTLRGPDWETMQVIQAARRLYRMPGQHLTLGQVVELSKRFMEGYLHYQNEPRIIELRKRVIAYNRLLRDMGIADHQVERASNRSIKSLLLLVYRTGLLLWWGLLSLPGVILHAPVFILAKVISIKKAKEALAASTVKIQGRDVLATWKVLVSLAVVPLLYVSYAAIATYLTYHYDLFLGYQRYVPIALLFFILPSLGYAALKFGEAGMDVLKKLYKQLVAIQELHMVVRFPVQPQCHSINSSLRPLFLSIVPNQHEVNKLRRMREGLTNDISEIIDEFGPQLYENFNKDRMLPSSSVPQTGRHQGLMSRKAQASDSVLSHPMLWLDERIFGWNRSAGIAQSVWGAPGLGRDRSRSNPPTAPGSPAESDDEQEEADVDYDDVLAVIDNGRRGGDGWPESPRAGRKRGGKSYGEMQSLREEKRGENSPIIPSMALQGEEEDGNRLTMRKVAAGDGV